MNQYWLRQNVILVSKRFPQVRWNGPNTLHTSAMSRLLYCLLVEQMAFQIQLVIVPLDLCSTESLLFEWLALVHRAVSLRQLLFAQELNHQRKASSPARLDTRDGYLESRGSPISEDISFLEVAHDDDNEKEDAEKESLDNTVEKCQALCCARIQPGTLLDIFATK